MERLSETAKQLDTVRTQKKSFSKNAAEITHEWMNEKKLKTEREKRRRRKKHSIHEKMAFQCVVNLQLIALLDASSSSIVHSLILKLNIHQTPLSRSLLNHAKVFDRDEHKMRNFQVFFFLLNLIEKKC